jgi:hypothetical protein
VSGSDVCERHRYRWAGRSDHAHPRCDRPQWLVCRDCGDRLHAACGASSRVKCVPCSVRYRRRVRRVFASGWTDNPLQRVYMLTVTPPGDDLHALPSGEVCPCTPEGGVSVPLFNATAGRSFSKLMVYMRRAYGDVQYGRAAECQDGKRRADEDNGRQAIHFHVLMRVERWQQLEHDYRPKDPYCALRLMIERCGFGHAIKLDLASEHAAHYCAKYVSKSAVDRDSMPWLDLATGEVTRASHYRTWSASRRWGSTMKAIKQEQAAWARAEEAAAAVAPATQPVLLAGAEGAGPLDPNTDYSTATLAVRGLSEWKETAL